MLHTNCVVLLAPYGSIKFKALARKVGVDGGKVPGHPTTPPPPVAPGVQG